MPEKPGITSLFRRSEIEKTTDSCSVCQEEVNFFGMYHHMRARHPDEFLGWMLWAAGTILAFLLPVAGIVLWLFFYGPTNGILIILVFVIAIIIAEIIVGRIGKSWERRVNEKWKATHPVSSKTRPKRGRKA